MVLNLGRKLGKSDFELEDLPDGPARFLYGLWRDKCAGRPMPAREDFSPLEMRACLPSIAMFDVEENPRRYRVRLYGTELVALSGIDLSGRYLDEIDGGEGVIERCDLIVSERRPRFRENIQVRWAPKSWRSYDVLALPLSRDGKRVDMILFHLGFK